MALKILPEAFTSDPDRLGPDCRGRLYWGANFFTERLNTSAT